ncbi:CopG family transcriptional regulator [Nostoc sp. FACHB-892]|uniref:ribbon-helix-helix domain-containing protein n=1 Tax=Nostoc sp. FACHB-892 TaxID=2692843 RepID=UPI00168A1982|nr:ribbon-helix-helix domain-containing protein [Nostoc sp. FACHB-892]MBD2730950.1 CopG family transcriptional regulator [Nostoc sp. FACHB-892]
MTKQDRNVLTELASQFSVDDLVSEITEKPKPRQKQQSSPKISKKQSQKTEDNLNLLEKLKQQQPTETTRITLDLDPETYEQLNQLAEHTGMTKAKLLRALIQETAKLLQK